MYPIVRREQFGPVTFLMEVLAPDVAKACEPGHFVMVRSDETGERIPLTVADFDRDAGTPGECDARDQQKASRKFHRGLHQVGRDTLAAQLQAGVSSGACSISSVMRTSVADMRNARPGCDTVADP